MDRRGSWEGVHGSIEPGESPHQAARRELLEETGLTANPLYNLSRVEQFYLHGTDEIALIPGFVAFVSDDQVQLSEEHDHFEWLTAPEAAQRFTWPRMAKGVPDVTRLFGGEIHPWLDDILRIKL